MKYIWEPDDIEAGRRVIPKRGHVVQMIFTDNSIGGASRFGLVFLTNGVVIERGRSPTELAEILTKQHYKPFTPVAESTDAD